ncbi:Beta-2 adrenergic receptor [Holothuria leucospilota]|uniref:Beta-2 adrenergic receptor n=1 Tax=Holothuria leucospilota TaxID=206669 RepID=A0A9Q1BSW2_HOLLE|nr:Beta-2 adrenergic receptor [Holothuria leucospilota]
MATENLTVLDGGLENSGGNGTQPYDDGAVITIISVSIQVLLISVIFTGNSLVSLLVLKLERLHTTSNFFIVSMSLGDIIVSLGMIPGVAITFDPFLLTNRYFCLCLWCSQMLGSSISCLSLLSITIDRYLKITNPLRSTSLMTMKKAGLVIASIWAYTFTMAIVLPFSGLTQQFQICFDFTSVFNLIHIQIYLVTCGLIPFVIMFLCYVHIFKVVLEKSRAMKQTEIAMENVMNNQNGGAAKGETAHGEKRRKSFLKPWIKREMRSLKTLVVVIGFTAVAWIPIDVILFKEIYNPNYTASLTVRTILSWFTYLNSAANPFIYALRSEGFRLALRQTFRLCRSKEDRTTGKQVARDIM